MQGSLGHKLRLMRAERGLSLREAARRAGMVKETISDIERGKTHPYDVTVARLAQAYEVPIEELLEEPALAGKAEAPADTGQPRRDPAFYDQEERLRRYLRVSQLQATKQSKLWAGRVERRDFGEEEFRKGVDALLDLEEAFVQGVGTDLFAALREDQDALPKAEREALDAAQASIDAWHRLLWEASDILKAAAESPDAEPKVVVAPETEAPDDSNVSYIDDYRGRLGNRPCAVGA
jgi:transcriptional regulator with XRE-family HTH domain